MKNYKSAEVFHSRFQQVIACFMEYIKEFICDASFLGFNSGEAEVFILGYDALSLSDGRINYPVMWHHIPNDGNLHL